jgi:hypothetical protein
MKPITQDTQDTFVNHLLKKIDRIFSEAIASLASMVVTTLKIVVSCTNNTQSLSTGMFFLYIYMYFQNPCMHVIYVNSTTLSSQPQ